RNTEPTDILLGRLVAQSPFNHRAGLSSSPIYRRRTQDRMPPPGGEQGWHEDC
ncbi:hypothetical protein ACJ72_08586, partial [Emergomyces africanus]